MKRLFLLLFVLSCTLTSVFAQDDELPPPSSKPNAVEQLPGTSKFVGIHKKRDLSKYIIEPDFNFSIFHSGLNFGLSPLFGHQLWKGLYGGGSLTYLYTGFRNLGYADATGNLHYANAHWNTFGAGAFLQYNIWRGFFVRGKVEVMYRILDDVYDGTVQLNMQTNSYNVQIPRIQKTIPDLLVGGGYNLLEGRNFFFPIMISYNVLHSVTNQLYAVYPTGWVFQLGWVQVF
jgi:hypothetical protein